MYRTVLLFSLTNKCIKFNEKNIHHLLATYQLKYLKFNKVGRVGKRFFFLRIVSHTPTRSEIGLLHSLLAEFIAPIRSSYCLHYQKRLILNQWKYVMFNRNHKHTILFLLKICNHFVIIFNRFCWFPALHIYKGGGYFKWSTKSV